MLRITVNSSPQGATRYYNEGLTTQDYYSEKGNIIGNWGGKLAAQLGLSGQVSKEAFESFCYNRDPNTGEQLTARNSDNRRVGYDFTFDVPKSVSIVYSQTEDKDILHSFRSAVADTMNHIEASVQTRVRANGAFENRDTANMIWGEFIHDTSRPVDGVPDCQLHSHNFVFNATWDEVEQKYKAIELGDVKSSANYYDAYFYNRLAENLQKSGYDIARNDTNFEISGIKRDTIDKFSNRTKEIEALAAEKKITDAKALANLGAKTRESKCKGLSPEEVKSIWRDRLSEDEYDTVLNAKQGQATESKEKISGKDALDFALSHHLERKSTVTEKELLTTAFKKGIGSVSIQEVKQAFLENEDIIRGSKKGKDYLTTKTALAEEKKLVETCREAKGKCKPLNSDYTFKADYLNPEQKAAITHVLKSKDKISVIEGGAGTGKTTLMQEVKTALEEKGKKLFAFAPSSEASRGVLESEGFRGAETVARLLIDPEMQQQLKGNVLWVDEAGMLGNKQMNQVLAIAKTQSARVVLTGDTRQHNSVERGDALRIMKQYGGIKPAEVREIQRQKQADYKKAVSLISKGEVEKGFSKLDKFGAIKEVSSTEDRCKQIAAEYVTSSQERKGKDFKSVLVVAPTHRENSLITSEIRCELKKLGKLEGDSFTFSRLENLQFTEAQKQDVVNYRSGQVIQFHKNVQGFKIGTEYQVSGRDDAGNVLLQDGKNKVKAFGLSLPSHFSVYQKSQLELCKGDQIRLTQNGKSIEGKRLNNGSVYQIQGFDPAGNIIASNGARIAKNYGNLAHGYAVTSHSSQGKTVDKVIIAQSSMSFGASSSEQFYVSVSRGKESVSIYTDDKKELLTAVSRTSQRLTASEIAKEAGFKSNVVKLDEHRERYSRLKALAQYGTQKAKESISKIPESMIRLISQMKSKNPPSPNIGRAK